MDMEELRCCLVIFIFWKESERWAGGGGGNLFLFNWGVQSGSIHEQFVRGKPKAALAPALILPLFFKPGTFNLIGFFWVVFKIYLYFCISKLPGEPKKLEKK